MESSCTNGIPKKSLCQCRLLAFVLKYLRTRFHSRLSSKLFLVIFVRITTFSNYFKSEFDSLANTYLIFWFYTDEKLFQFLFSCFYDVEKTKKCIYTCLRIKSTSPEIYCNRDISDPDLQKVLSHKSVEHWLLKNLQELKLTNAYHFCSFCSTIFTIPVLTPEKHYRITFLRVDSTNTTDFDFNKIIKIFFMAYDAELYLRGTARGHIIVFDFKNIGWRQIMKTSLDTWKKLIQLTQVLS